MKYSIEPKPIEYDSLTRAKLATRIEMGPVEFSVSTRSHEKSLMFLNQYTEVSPLDLDVLLPSEMWGTARVLSEYFGRLNEVAMSKPNWEIFGMVYPEEKLIAKTKVIKTYMRKDISFGLVQTETSTSSGRLLMRQTEEILLFNESPWGFYREREVIDRGDSDIEIPRKIYHRFNWNPDVWKNNIHNDEYARRFGYMSGLPEFIVYMDFIYDSVMRAEGKSPYYCTIDVPLILPMYIGDRIIVKISRTEKGYDVRFTKNDALRLRSGVALS